MSELALRLIEENKKTKDPYLDLGRCGLTELPEALGECVWIEELILSDGWADFDFKYKKYTIYKSTKNKGINNNIVEIKHLGNLIKLKKLIISGNRELRNIYSLFNIQNLEYLDCSKTMIYDLIPLSKLFSLKYLDCSSTNINDLLPISLLVNLLVLDHSNTYVNEIKVIENLTNLQVLDCSNSRVRHLTSIENLINLHTLYCVNTPVIDLLSISRLSNLKILHCSKSHIKDLNFISDLINLHTLQCSKTQISDLTPISNLLNLQILHCAETRISDLTPISQLVNLKILNCSETEVSNLTPIAQLVNLESLHCSKTRVSNLIPISQLFNLKFLVCSQTMVSDLTPIIKLPNLQTLYCPKTQVVRIFPLSQATSLQRFNFDGCPIEDCPSDVYQSRDIETLRAFFSVASTQGMIAPDTRSDVKLILLGNSDAGKTSLIHYLETGEFLKKRDSTHGLEVRRWLPDPERFPLLKDIAVSIWDFGGQEYYHGAYRLFMSNNAVYLLIWDIETNCNGKLSTSLKTGEKEVDLEHFEMAYWLDTVRHYGGIDNDTPLLVIQNKTDRKGKHRLDQKIHTDYKINESLHLSLYLACMPDQPRESLLLRQFDLELTQTLIATVDKNPLPADWARIRQSILDLQQGDKNSPFSDNLKEDGSILLKDFEKVSEKIIGRKLSKQESGNTLPGIFNRGGVVIFFSDSTSLSDRVFLKPAELATRIYELLKKEVLDRGGEFIPEDLFGKHDPFKKVFLEAAQKLELIFPHPDTRNKKDWYIAPQYLPASHPIEDLFRIASHGAWQSAYWLKVPLFYYKKLLHGLVIHYTSDPETEAKYFWKHGIIFVKGGIRVLIKGLYPAEDEREGILLIGVEQKPDSSHRSLQREIFMLCLQLLSQRSGQPALQPEQSMKRTSSGETVFITINQKLDEPIIITKDLLEQQQNRPSQLSENDIPSWLEVSADNTFYVKYAHLVKIAQNNEIRIEGHNKDGESTRLLIRDFEPLLDRPPQRAKRVFVSYSHRNTHWLGRLRAHLSGLRRSNEVEDWTDQEILPGDLWDRKIKDALAEADVFILLLSADFIESEYIWNIELKTAMERFKKAHKIVIPILVEPIDLGGLPGVTEITDENGLVKELKVQDFEIVPKDNSGYLKAVSLWVSHEEALAIVAQRIRAAIMKK